MSCDSERGKSTDCFYYIRVETYDVGSHSRGHPMRFIYIYTLIHIYKKENTTGLGKVTCTMTRIRNGKRKKRGEGEMGGQSRVNNDMDSE